MNPLTLSIKETQQASSLGRTKIYELIKHGCLKAYKIGKRTVILRSDLEGYLNGLERYPTNLSARSVGE